MIPDINLNTPARCRLARRSYHKG